MQNLLYDEQYSEAFHKKMFTEFQIIEKNIGIECYVQKSSLHVKIQRDITDTQSHTGIPRDIQKARATYRAFTNTQGHEGTYRDAQGHIETHRDTQGHTRTHVIY